MTTFKCQRCGKCCGIVPFSKDEYNAIRKYAKDKHIGFVKAELQGKTVYFPKHAYKKFLQAAGNYTDTGIISWSVSGYAA